MKNLQEYLSQLSRRDRALLVFIAVLFGFIILKLFIVDSLAKSNKNLESKSAYVQSQAELLAGYKGNVNSANTALTASNQVINSFLKKTGNAEKLKQIRTTSKGEKRFEIEEIRFDEFVELLGALDSNGSNYSSLQVKTRKTPGVVNVVMTLPN